MKYNLPVIAQWGYNNGMAEWLVWNEKSSNFWSSKSKERGYTLGAHSARLLDDFVAEPEPLDIGYLFPRQFPVWSATLYNKTTNPSEHLIFISNLTEQWLMTLKLKSGCILKP